MITVNDPQIQPHDLELERTVIGHCLKSADVYRLYTNAGLSQTDFYRTVHVWIFEAIKDLNAKGIVSDLATVGYELRSRNLMDEVGPVYYSRLTDDASPHRDNIPHLVGQLKGLSTARKVIKLAEIARAQLKTDPSAVTGDFFAEHLSALEAIRQDAFSAENDFLDAEQQIAAHDDYIAQDDSLRVSFALGDAVDEATSQGMRAGEVAGLLARPGVGKTIAMCNMAYQLGLHNAELGHMFFSLEMPAPQIIERLRRLVYGMSKDALRDAIKGKELDPEPYRRIFRNLVIVDRPGLSVSDIENRVQQAQARRFKDAQIGLCSIDHLGLLGGGDGQGTYDRVSKQARELKELAKRCKVPLFIAVQVSRESGGDGSLELNLGAARDSGVIEEVCDYMIGMRNKSLNRKLKPEERIGLAGQRHVKLIKNRHGECPAAESELYFNGRTLTLSDIQTAA